MKSLAFPMVFGLAFTTPALSADPDAEQIARGAYLATIMDCAGCHLPRGADGAPIIEAGLSGGTIGFEIPGLGIFWPPNLTPDASGLGGWSDAEIAAAIIGGTARDGRMLAPVMPSPSYAALAPEDLNALIAWLRAQPPVEAPRFGPVAAADDALAPFYRVTLPPQ
ncbi:c-type cytochrome [Tabrizicola caldifontis]|uniref:c-type cytochrome n=1 Tax=Tabrizicola caldifontis TaxID=2528036 RepID=UPI001436BA50|nr:c-type cytochrome [Rhodobacter sp. YIM 73028]